MWELAMTDLIFNIDRGAKKGYLSENWEIT